MTNQNNWTIWKKLTACALAVLMLAGTTACGNDSGTKSANQDSSASASKNTDSNTKDNADTKDADNTADQQDLKFAIQEFDMNSAQKDTFNAKIYGLETLPITDINALGEKWCHGRDGESFDQLLEEKVLADDSESLGDNRKTSDLTEEERITFTPDLNFVNYSSESMTLRDALNKGWWYVSGNEYAIALNDGRSLDNAEPDKSMEEEEFIPELFQELGRPTEVKILRHDKSDEKFEDFKVTLNDDKVDVAIYELDYVYPDYTVTMQLTESLSVGSKGTSHHFELHSVCYYPKTCWEEQQKKTE